MIQILSDSTVDLPPAEAKALNVSILPLTIHFGNQTYRDGIDITHEEFYRRLRQAVELPTTSQINPACFEEAFRKVLAAGDQAVVLTLSGRLSNTAQSAMVAARNTDQQRIQVVDSGSVSLASGILLREAVRLRSSGESSAAVIAEHLRALASRLRLFAVVDTLKYLRMGGRLSSGAAFVGEVLNIIPLIRLVGGQVEVFGRVRGEKKAIRSLLTQVAEDPPDFSYEIVFGHTDAPERLARYMEIICPQLGDDLAYRSGSVGSIIGTHAGPGAVGLAYIARG